MWARCSEPRLPWECPCPCWAHGNSAAGQLLVGMSRGWELSWGPTNGVSPGSHTRPSRAGLSCDRLLATRSGPHQPTDSPGSVSPVHTPFLCTEPTTALWLRVLSQQGTKPKGKSHSHSDRTHIRTTGALRAPCLSLLRSGDSFYQVCVCISNF